MTRARARTIENEVDSLLLEFRSESHENWVLPHKDMLCILGHQGDDREKEKGKLRASMEQENKGEAKEKEGKKLLDTPGAQPPAGDRPWRPRVPGHSAWRWLEQPGCPAPSAARGPAP